MARWSARLMWRVSWLWLSVNLASSSWIVVLKTVSSLPSSASTGSTKKIYIVKRKS